MMQTPPPTPLAADPEKTDPVVPAVISEAAVRAAEKNKSNEQELGSMDAATSEKGTGDNQIRAEPHGNSSGVEPQEEVRDLEAEIDADMEKLGRELEELNAKEGVSPKEKADAAKRTRQKLEAHARYMRYSRCVNSRLGLSSSQVWRKLKCLLY